MNILLIILIGFLSFTANAADNEPTPASECSQPKKGCSSNTIDASCAKMACQAAGCNSDYSSGDCFTLKKLHDAAFCGDLASSKCGSSLPRKIVQVEPAMNTPSNTSAERPAPQPAKTDQFNSTISSVGTPAKIMTEGSDQEGEKDAIQTTDLEAEKPSSNQRLDTLGGKMGSKAGAVLAPVQAESAQSSIQVAPLVVKKAGSAGQADFTQPVRTSTESTVVTTRIAPDGLGSNSFVSCNSESMTCSCTSFSTCKKMEKECRNPEDIKCKTGTFNCSCEWKGKVGGSSYSKVKRTPASNATSE